MSEQYIYGGTVDQLATGANSTMPAYGSRVAAGAWTESLWAIAGTAGKLRIRLDVAPGAGKSWSFGFHKNGGAAEFSVVISGTDTTGYSSSTFAVAAGDYLEIIAVPTNTPAAAYVGWCWTWEPTTADQTILAGQTDGAQLDTSLRYLPCGSVNTAPSVAAQAGLWLPIAGTVSDLHVKLETAPGVGNRKRIFRFRKNAVLQSLTVDIDEAATTGSDTVNSFAVAVGDYIDLRASTFPFGDPNPAASHVSWSCVFTPDIADYFLVPSNSPDVLISGTGIEYRQICTGGSSTAWNASVTARQAPSHRAEVVALGVHITVLPSSGNWTFTTSQSVTGPYVRFDSGSALTQVAHASVIMDDGDVQHGRYAAVTVGGPVITTAEMCVAMRAIRAEGAPFMF